MGFLIRVPFPVQVNKVSAFFVLRYIGEVSVIAEYVLSGFGTLKYALYDFQGGSGCEVRELSLLRQSGRLRRLSQ